MASGGSIFNDFPEILLTSFAHFKQH